LVINQSLYENSDQFISIKATVFAHAAS